MNTTSLLSATYYRIARETADTYSANHARVSLHVDQITMPYLTDDLSRARRVSWLTETEKIVRSIDRENFSVRAHIKIAGIINVCHLDSWGMWVDVANGRVKVSHETLRVTTVSARAHLLTVTEQICSSLEIDDTNLFSSLWTDHLASTAQNVKNSIVALGVAARQIDDAVIADRESYVMSRD